MEVYIKLTADEIREMVPYAVVCETMSSSRWNTGRRKRLMREWFTECERNACNRLHAQARTWYLYKGVPDEVVMKPTTLALWHKLAGFCCEL